MRMIHFRLLVWTRRSLGRGAILATILLATGCTLPRAVASLGEVQSAAADGQITLVPVTAATLPPPPIVSAGFPADLISAPEADYERLGPGDRLNIRIWESGEPSLFSKSGGISDLGDVAVDENGRLYVPYVGAIRVAGMTVSQVRKTVIDRLSTVILHPQVDIRPVEHRSMLVSVQGNATKSGTFPIERGRTRLGSLLAEVAPDQKNPDMLNVTVRRDGKAATVRLADIYRNPRLDIALRPGDSIVLNDVVEDITVLGAAGVQGQVRIPKREFSLTDALGEARGINEDAADPRAVFVVRAAATPDTPPLVYHFDMRQPGAIALASRFVMRDNDAVMISRAPFAQVRNVLTAFAQTVAGVRSATLINP